MAPKIDSLRLSKIVSLNNLHAICFFFFSFFLLKILQEVRMKLFLFFQGIMAANNAPSTIEKEQVGTCCFYLFGLGSEIEFKYWD